MNMRAAQYTHYGNPDVLQITDVPIPQITENTVLVRIVASSVNAADVGIRSGRFKLVAGKNFPRGTGFDFVGEIVEAGSGVTGFEIGAQVWGFINTGAKLGTTAAAAEYILVPADWIAPAPRTLDPIHAAALPGAAGAALGVLRAAQVNRGDRILIRGAAGGVGTAAVQLAASMGAKVTALVRGAHVDRIRQLGAQDAYDYATVKPDELGTFEVIFDTVGTGARAYRRQLADAGRYLTIAPGSATDIAYMLTSAIFGRRRIRFVKSPPDAALLAALAEQTDAGHIAPVVDHIFDLNDIADAHRAAERGGAFGKQVIQTA